MFGSFNGSYFHHMGSDCKIGYKLARRYSSVSAIILGYFAHRNLIDIRCRVPWGLKGGV